MKCAVYAIIACLAVCATAQSADGISSVITLLEGLVKKIEHDHTNEEVLYARFTIWCSEESTFHKHEIETAQKTLETATLRAQTSGAAATSAASELEQEVANAAEIIKKREAAQTAHDAATAASSTQSESLEGVIVACGEALTLLETAKSGVTLLDRQRQVRRVAVLAGSKVESSARATIEAFCQIPSRQPFLANGTAVEHERAYGHKGQTVIDLIKDLKSKFTEDLAVLQREMQNSQNAHDVLSVHLDNELLESQKMQGILSAKRTRESGIEIQAKEEAQEASTYLGENQDALRDVTQTCASKTEEWAQHEATRTGETKAILQAIDVLAQSAHIKVTTATATDGTNSADTGASSTDVSLPTTITPTSFLQFPTQVGQKILNLLNQAGLNLHAHKLQRLVAELTQHSSTGHLDSVIEHMKIIIFDLNSEQLQEDKVFQNIEAEWKKWTMKHSEAVAQIATLTDQKSEEVLSRDALETELSATQDRLVEVKAHIEEMKVDRKTEKDLHEQNVADANQAQASIMQAIKILEDFYKNSGMLSKEAWESLLQNTSRAEEPITWATGKYTGITDPTGSHGVISILEQVYAEFQRMSAEFQAAETTSQVEFDKELTDNTVLGSELKQKIQNLEAQVARAQEHIDELDRALDSESEAKEGYELYLNRLTEVGGSGWASVSESDDGIVYNALNATENRTQLPHYQNYLAKKSAREVEIKALTEAVTILQEYKVGSSSFVAHRVRRHVAAHRS